MKLSSSSSFGCTVFSWLDKPHLFKNLHPLPTLPSLIPSLSTLRDLVNFSFSDDLNPPETFYGIFPVIVTGEDFGPFFRVRGDFSRVSAPWNYFEQVVHVAAEAMAGGNKGKNKLGPLIFKSPLHDLECRVQNTLTF